MNRMETGEQQKGLVTVIVPCYNYGHFLSETLDSVLQQEYANWECIIVNDGSTDNTEELAKSYVKKDARFRYIFQKNKGLSAARNTGIRNSKGEFLQFLDSDDLIHPSKLAIQVDLMNLDFNIDILYGDSLFFSGNAEDRLSVAQRKKSKGHDPAPHVTFTGMGITVLRLLLVNNIMTVSCALVRKNIFLYTEMFDEGFTSYEDWQFWINCVLNDRCFCYLPRPGTETFIRYGHKSMLTDKKRLTANAILLRKLLEPRLRFKERLYNRYRLLKLNIRKLFSIY